MSLLDDLGRSSEGVILQRARDGDAAAFGWLYEQHLAAARRLARSLVADHSDADDVVAEVYAAAFAAMRRGLGPADDFRSYLLTSVRRECQRTWRTGARQRPGGDVVVDLASARTASRDEYDGFDEDDVVHRAFAALSPRMQHVLWLTEIEGLGHDEVAVRMGTSSTAVAQLARRARLEFGERYLGEHLPATDEQVPAACVEPRRVLAEVVRGTASRRSERVAADHMATCPACSDAEVELRVVNGRLRSGHVLALLPAIMAPRPERAGLLARFLAWVSGPVPTISAVATLAFATAVAPEGGRVDEPTTAAIEVVVPVGAGVLPSGAADAVPVAVDANDVDAGSGTARATAEHAVDEPFGLVAETDAAPPAPVADTSATLPVGAAVLGALPGAAGPVPLPAIADVTGGVADIVNGVTVDDGVVGALGPVLGALPDIGVAVTLPPTPDIGPLGSTGPVAAEVGVGGGQIDVTASVGDAGLGATVGGDGGVQVDLPTVPEIVDALPAPVPAVVDALPIVGPLLGD